MSDAEIIKALLGLLVGMIGLFYADFRREIRRHRRNMHSMRNTLSHHEFRLINIERHLKFEEYEYPKDEWES